MLKDLLQQGYYLVKIDLKYDYLTVPICKKQQTYIRFLWKDSTWEFACFPFGRMRTQGVLNIYQSCSGGVKADVFKVSNLFGRLSDNVSIPSSVLDTCVDCTRSPQGFEFCSKLRKIQFNPLPDNIISWLWVQLCVPYNHAPKTQDQNNQERMTTPDRFAPSFSLRVIKVPVPPNFLYSGNLCSSSSQSATFSLQNIRHWGVTNPTRL